MASGIPTGSSLTTEAYAQYWLDNIGAETLRPSTFSSYRWILTGGPLDPTRLARILQALTEPAGVRRIRLHDMRHTCASLLLAQHVPPRIVMEILGRSQLSMTMDLYSHVMPTALTDAAGAVNGRWERPDEPRCCHYCCQGGVAGGFPVRHRPLTCENVARSAGFEPATF